MHVKCWGDGGGRDESEKIAQESVNGTVRPLAVRMVRNFLCCCQVVRILIEVGACVPCRHVQLGRTSLGEDAGSQRTPKIFRPLKPIKSSGCAEGHRNSPSYDANLFGQIHRAKYQKLSHLMTSQASKQTLSASCDVMLAGRLCSSLSQRGFPLGDGRWLPLKVHLKKGKLAYPSANYATTHLPVENAFCPGYFATTDSLHFVSYFPCNFETCEMENPVATPHSAKQSKRNHGVIPLGWELLQPPLVQGS